MVLPEENVSGKVVSERRVEEWSRERQRGGVRVANVGADETRVVGKVNDD